MRFLRLSQHTAGGERPQLKFWLHLGAADGSQLLIRMLAHPKFITKLQNYVAHS